MAAGCVTAQPRAAPCANCVDSLMASFNASYMASVGSTSEAMNRASIQDQPTPGGKWTSTGMSASRALSAVGALSGQAAMISPRV